VNKDKPMMHCNGKCYLSKKIKEQEKQDHQTPISKTEKFNIVPFVVPKPFELGSTTSEAKTEFFIRNEGHTFSLPHSIFHPPSV
jgi:hypothetical protein